MGPLARGLTVADALLELGYLPYDLIPDPVQGRANERDAAQYTDIDAGHTFDSLRSNSVHSISHPWKMNFLAVLIEYDSPKRSTGLSVPDSLSSVYYCSSRT